MEQLVRFQSLIRSLTDKEFNAFRVKFVADMNKSLFITMLFAYFKHEIESNDQKSQTPNAINKILKNIINKRKPTSNKPNAIKLIPNSIHKTHINDLSNDLLANIGSYLCLNNHINFSLCNRFIYISIQSKPISISKMKLE
eukprot:299680_1